MLGDNRNNSEDSRYADVGVVSGKNIEGKVWFILSPSRPYGFSKVKETRGYCMNYQWYPGHMTKARRMMQEDIKLIDLVIELVDARVPFSSRNPDIDELAKNKSRLILLNKSDLADKAKTAHWVEYFQQKGFYVLELNAKTGAGMKAIDGVVKEACRKKSSGI